MSRAISWDQYPTYQLNIKKKEKKKGKTVYICFSTVYLRSDFFEARKFVWAGHELDYFSTIKTRIVAESDQDKTKSYSAT